MIQNVNSLPAKARDLDSIPGLGISLGDGNGDPLQYSCLENPMDREAWQATVHGVTKSRTRLRLTLSLSLNKCSNYDEAMRMNQKFPC